ncbi:MAG: TolC family protein [Saprospiraceae bacterium]
MKLFFPLLLLGFCQTFAQSLLTLKDALLIASSENYDIQLATNDQLLAKHMEYYGNAGEQPVYIFQASDNAQLLGVNQKLANGNEISKVGVPSNAFSSNVGISYPVFNKFRTNAVKNRIVEQTNIAQKRTILQTQNIAAQVIVKYYEIVRQKKLIKSLQTTLDVSLKRLEIIKTKLSLGLSNNTDLYLAELDLNSRQQEVVNQELLLKQNKAELNSLLSLAVDNDFQVSDTIDINPDLNIDDLIAKSKQNPELLISQSQSKVLEWLEKETHSQRLPTVRLNGGLAANVSNTTAGFLLQNLNYGPFVGASFSVPLLNHNIFDRQEQLVSMQRKSNDINTKSVENKINSNIYRLFIAYQTQLNNIEVESKNIKTAKQYLEIMLERYKLNQSNAIELRESQTTYEQSVFRLVSAQFATKVVETELLRLSGSIFIVN